MLIDILGYREWAKEIFQAAKDLSEGSDLIWHWHKDDRHLCDDRNLTFLIGWSDILPREYYEDVPTFVLHPSKLPKYRGGSPIQNQILDGMTRSAVTIFSLDIKHPKVDSGPIAWQMAMSLDGEMTDILHRISTIGFIGVTEVVNRIRSETLVLTPQIEEEATTYKRRKPKDSEITREELATSRAEDLYNKVRALQSPYPTAFISTIDGRLYIEKARYE